MLEPMNITPPTSTPAKINIPVLLGFFDSFSCTECPEGGAGATGGGGVATVALAVAAEAIMLLSVIEILGSAEVKPNWDVSVYTQQLLQSNERSGRGGSTVADQRFWVK